MELNSCLYEATTHHVRFAPKIHRLSHRFFLFYIDLDELDELAQRFALFSRNGWNLFSFYDRDHFPGNRRDIKSKVLAYVNEQGFREKIERVMLLTMPRILGHVFNPVSFYFCFDAAQKCRCSIAEVGNTFGEMKLYFLGPERVLEKGRFQLRAVKHFYVSPFLALDDEFAFDLVAPEGFLSLGVDTFSGREKILSATLRGNRRKFSTGALIFFSLRHPLVTVGVILAIHWNAFLLFLKHIPYFSKKARPELQKEILKLR